MPHTAEPATMCANPACTRAKHHPGLCTDEIAARTGLTIEQVQTVLDFEAGISTDNPQNIQAGDRVSLTVSECPDPVTGGIVRVYRDAIGSLVADIAIGDDVRPQNVEFLTRDGSGFEPTYRQVVISLGREWRGTKSSGRPLPPLDALFAELHAVAGHAGVSMGRAHNDFWDEVDGREWA